MVTKQNIFNVLICLTLVSFGFFGSLSHIFSLALIILIFINYTAAKQKNDIEFNSKIVFLALTACFFLFLFTGIFNSNFESLLHSLSPMLPLPFIGILIVLHHSANLKLSSKEVSQFAQISVLFSLVVYLFLSMSNDPNSFYYRFHTGRLVLFSGNPIPFSFVMLGLAVFCLANWKNSKRQNKIVAFSCFLIGAYMAGFLSGTRGTLLCLIVISPIVTYYLSNQLVVTLLITSILASSSIVFIYPSSLGHVENEYFDRIKNGLDTLILLKSTDSSVWQRLEMWSAAIKAISDNPLLGYGIHERFLALRPHLHSSVPNYSHPHNDIFAGILANGILGGFTVLISLISGLIAALLTPKWYSEKLYYGLMFSCSSIVTASVSTILFNDISSAWLAFSTYLIWATDFTTDEFNLSKSKK